MATGDGECVETDREGCLISASLRWQGGAMPFSTRPCRRKLLMSAQIDDGYKWPGGIGCWYLWPVAAFGVVMAFIAFALGVCLALADRLYTFAVSSLDSGCERYRTRKENRDIRSLWEEIAIWSQVTFGYDYARGPEGPLKHIKLECDEALQFVMTDDGLGYDVVEFADIGILWLDASRRAGFTFRELLDAMREKMKANKLREWPRPVPGSDEPILHVEEFEAKAA